MSVAARTGDRLPATAAALAPARAGALSLLAGLVAASFLLRTVLGWLRATPTFFPDEYLYAELARSIAETGRPLVRGAGASFPALLQPIVTAPAWLFEDVETSFRLVQTAGALLMSLAAVPVFLLAGRLGLGRGTALALAALTLAVPDMLYASWVVAEPLAYPLALAAFAAGVSALARPGPRAQLAFLGLAGLATFARAQFAILPLCLLAAAALAGLRERRLRSALREQAIVAGVLAAGAAAAVAVGPARALGIYEILLDTSRLSPALLRWVGSDAMMLVYASGVVLAPGALLGLWLALRRPRTRTELAFGALALPVVLGLLVEAALWGMDSSRVQERYFFYAVPLLALAFALYASRGFPHRLAHAAAAAGLAVAVARVPLAGLSAADGKTNAPTLFAATRLEQAIGDVGLASLAIALLGTALLAAVSVAVWRGRSAAPVAFGLALATSAALSTGALSFTIANADRARANVLGPQPSFVDRSGIGSAALLQSRSSDRGFAAGYLFWNRTVKDVYYLADAEAPDAFAASRLTTAPDGTLLAGGEPVTRPLLVDGWADIVRFRASEEAAASPVYRLLRAEAPHRLALYAPGFYEDGWLGLFGGVSVWPEEAAEGLAGTLAFRLTAPADEELDLAVTFEPEGAVSRKVVLEPGAAREVAFRVCAPGPWRLRFDAPSTGAVGSRFVSVRASEPAFRPDPAACS